MKAFPALFAAAAMLAVSPPALAQAPACVAPTAPTVPDGAAASLDEMKAAGAAVKDFIAASDAFQQCEVDGVTAARAAAKAAKAKFDNDLAEQSQARISANQKDKEAAGGAFAAARKAYLAAHPAS